MRGDPTDRDVSDIIEDDILEAGVDATVHAVLGPTRHPGKDACREVFGGGILGGAAYWATNILTGGALSLTRWIGVAERVTRGERRPARVRRRGR